MARLLTLNSPSQPSAQCTASQSINFQLRGPCSVALVLALVLSLDFVPDFAFRRITGPSRRQSGSLRLPLVPRPRPRSRRQSRFLRFPPVLVVDVFLVDPGLHIVRLLEAALEGVHARPVASAVQAILAMSLFATGVGAPDAHPRDHAPAAEAPAALTLRETALLRLEQGGAAGAGAVFLVSGVFSCGVSGAETVVVLAAGFVRVLGFVAVEARLEATVLASEDSTVFLAIEGLEELGAAAHADGADFELFGVSK